MNDELEIANLVLLLVKASEKQTEQDLTFSYNQFIKSEEYEKCELINEVIKSQKFSSEIKYSYSYQYLWYQKEKEEIKFLLKKLSELNEETQEVKNSTTGCLKELNSLENDEKEFWDSLRDIQEITECLMNLRKEISIIDEKFKTNELL